MWHLAITAPLSHSDRSSRPTGLSLPIGLALGIIFFAMLITIGGCGTSLGMYSNQHFEESGSRPLCPDQFNGYTQRPTETNSSLTLEYQSTPEIINDQHTSFEPVFPTEQNATTIETDSVDLVEPSHRSPQMAALLEMDDETFTGKPPESFFSTSRIIRGAQIAITIASLNPWVKAGLIGLLAVVEYAADGSDFHSFLDEIL